LSGSCLVKSKVVFLFPLGFRYLIFVVIATRKVKFCKFLHYLNKGLEVQACFLFVNISTNVNRSWALRVCGFVSSWEKNTAELKIY